MLKKTDKALSELLKLVENGTPLVIFVKNKAAEDKMKINQEIDDVFMRIKNVAKN